MTDCEVMLPNLLAQMEDCDRFYAEQVIANHNCHQHGLTWACDLKENLQRKVNACLTDEAHQMRAFEKCVSGVWHERLVRHQERLYQ